MTNKTRKNLLKAIVSAAETRYDYISSFFNGEKPLTGPTKVRSYRFEGNITLRDTIRVQGFLDDICNNGRINTTRFYQLSSDIPAFCEAITQALYSKIDKYINS